MAYEHLRNQVASEVKARGTQTVAKELGVAREPLLAFCLGVCRDGTDLLVADCLVQRAAVRVENRK